jgi:hypothetical protein
MRFAWSLLALPLVPACAPTVQPTLPDPNADVGLGEVALLVWTTRSPSGLLGHPRDAATGKVDANRRVVSGNPQLTPTEQHLVVVSAQTLDAGAEAGVTGMKANAAVNRATHVAYDVRITGYLELSPEDTKYLPSSGCCQGGGVSETCGESYVTRLIRGTGTVQHLQQLSATGGVEASELVRAHGGTSYRRLNETRFVDAFFAYQLEPMATLCSRLSPEDEIETMAVSAPNNCWVQAHLEDGKRESRAWHVPDAPLCKKLAEHHCQAQQRVAACTASFGRDGQAAPLALGDEPAPSAVPAAASAPAATPAPTTAVAAPPPAR